MENPLLPIYAVAGIDCCFGSALFLYNIAGLISFMREDTGGESSGALAKAAWLIGFLALFILPCAWFLGPLAMILASVERRRIYSEAAPLAGATPCRMGSINGGVALLLWLIMLTGAIVTQFAAGAAA